MPEKKEKKQPPTRQYLRKYIGTLLQLWYHVQILDIIFMSSKKLYNGSLIHNRNNLEGKIYNCNIIKLQLEIKEKIYAKE